jgi:hypothetical protein
VDLARGDWKLFPPSDYWDRVESRISQLPVETVTAWAREGLEALPQREGWELLLLDLGDCPEMFFLYSPGGQPHLDEAKVRRWLICGPVIDCTDLEHCFARPVEAPFEYLFSDDHVVWSEHNVRELDDEVLTWNRGESFDYHGNSGYLLWLALGSLALLDPLRDAGYCRQILEGREKLYLLAGFEQIFCYLGTVTPAGLVFEAPSS